MKYIGIILSVCVAMQVAEALPEKTLNMLCPKGAEQKKASPLRTRLKNMEKGVDAVDKKGKSALMLAAEQGNRVAVCFLVAAGANVTMRDKDKKSAIDYTRNAELRELLMVSSESNNSPARTHEQWEQRAMELGLATPEDKQKYLWKLVSAPRNLAAVKEALSLGAELNVPGPDGKYLKDVRGISPECLAYLMRRGYRVDAKGKNYASPLHGDMSTPLAHLVLAYGLEAEMSDDSGLIWQYLFTDNVKEMEGMLKEDGEFAKMRSEGNRPLLALAQSGAMVRALVAAGADVKEEGLIEGIISHMKDDPRSADVVSELIKAGASLPEDALLSMCRTGNADGRMVRALLSAGGDVNAEDRDGNTPLHLVLINSTEPAILADAVKALMKAGANAKAKNAGGKSPEMLAKSMGRGGEDLIKLMKKPAAK